jgi:hypothetical protein
MRRPTSLAGVLAVSIPVIGFPRAPGMTFRFLSLADLRARVSLLMEI